MIPKWDKEKYSVSNEVLDEQHEHLFNIAFEAYKVANNPAGASREDIKNVIMKFFDYCNVHFKDEEKYMELIDYPKKAQHKAAHRQMLQELKKMIKNIKTGNELKDHICNLAETLFIPHILKDDMQIEEYRKISVKENPTLYMYIYHCGCDGREYKLNEQIHLFLKKNVKGFNCRKCKKKLVFVQLDMSIREASKYSTADVTPPPPPQTKSTAHSLA